MIIAAVFAVLFALMYRGPLSRLGDRLGGAEPSDSAAPSMALVIALISIQSGGLVNVMPVAGSPVGAIILLVGSAGLTPRAHRDPLREPLRHGSRSSPSWCCWPSPSSGLPTSWTSRTARSSRSSSCSWPSSRLTLTRAGSSWVRDHRPEAPARPHARRCRRWRSPRTGRMRNMSIATLLVDLRVHGPWPQHRRRTRRPARPRLHRVPGRWCRTSERSSLIPRSRSAGRPFIVVVIMGALVSATSV